jgi:hypothetical protein
MLELTATPERDVFAGKFRLGLDPTRFAFELVLGKGYSFLSIVEIGHPC